MYLFVEMKPKNSTSPREVHLTAPSNTLRANAWGQAFHLTEPAPPYDGTPESILAIVSWLGVEKSGRWRPKPGTTYCNVYAYDLCNAIGAYAPRVWWGNKSDAEPVLGKNVFELSANALYSWFVQHSEEFGWKKVKTLDELQDAANAGNAAVIVGKNKNAQASGHICCVVPESGKLMAKRVDGQVVLPVQSQAGAYNYELSLISEWWKSPSFAEFGFWVHSKQVAVQPAEEPQPVTIVVDATQPVPYLPHMGTKNAPSGFGVWIAFQGMIGSIDESIRRMKAIGATWVAPRAGVGSKRDGNWTPEKARAAIAKYHAAGIKVFPWVYSRPDSYLEEIPVFKALMDEGADGVFIDAEIEWEGPGGVHRAAAADFMERLRVELGEGCFIAHAPFPYVLWHQDFPYVEFGSRCDAVCDQLYWTEINGASAASHVENTGKQWAEYLKKNPTACKLRSPIGITYGSELKGVAKPPPGKMRPEDLRFFIEWCKKQCLPFYSIYSLEASTPESIAVLQELAGTDTSVCFDAPPEGSTFPQSNWSTYRNIFNAWQTRDDAHDLIGSLAGPDVPEQKKEDALLAPTDVQGLPWYISFIRFILGLLAALFSKKSG